MAGPAPLLPSHVWLYTEGYTPSRYHLPSPVASTAWYVAPDLTLELVYLLGALILFVKCVERLIHARKSVQ